MSTKKPVRVADVSRVEPLAAQNLRKNGRLIGQISNSGTIRMQGRLWGNASSCCSDSERRTVAAAIVFFGEFFD